MFFFQTAGGGEQAEPGRRVQTGGDFADQVSGRRQFYGKGRSLFRQDVGNEKHGSHADGLFRDLGRGGNQGPAHAVIVSVDAGVNRGKGDGQGHKRQQAGAGLFQQDIAGQGKGEPADQKGQQQAEAKGDQQGGAEHGFALSGIGGDKAGQGRLYGAGAQRKADAVNWMHHVVEAQALGTDGAGEKDAVKKAQHPGEETGGGEQQCARDQGMFFQKTDHGGSPAGN